MEIKDRVVIVTGASRGIGKAIAQLFSENGAHVALVARAKDKLRSLEKELPGSFAVPADMTKEDEIKNMVQAVKSYYGRIDILINNAGQGYDASVEHINPHSFGKIFDLDLLGPIIAMQAVIPIMRKQKAGAIVNISSGTALMVLPHMSPYAALKQALAKISLTARVELKKDNIHVSVVYPYITDTEFEQNTIKEASPNEQEEQGDFGLPPADPPEYVAKIVLKGLQNNEAEIFAHGWMKPGK